MPELPPEADTVLANLQPTIPSWYDEDYGLSETFHEVHSLSRELIADLSSRSRELLGSLCSMNEVAASELLGYAVLVREEARRCPGYHISLITRINQPRLGWNFPAIDAQPVYLAVGGEANFAKVQKVVGTEISGAHDMLKLVNQSDQARGYSLEIVPDALGNAMPLFYLTSSFHQIGSSDGSNDILCVEAPLIGEELAKPWPVPSINLLAMQVESVKSAAELAIVREFRNLVIAEYVVTRASKVGQGLLPFDGRVVRDIVAVGYTLERVDNPPTPAGEGKVVGVLRKKRTSKGTPLYCGELAEKLALLWPKFGDAEAKFDQWYKEKLSVLTKPNTGPASWLVPGLVGFLSGKAL
jgi:hypothetical protein